MKDYFFEKYKKYSSLWLQYVALGFNDDSKYFRYADSLEIMMKLYYAKYMNCLSKNQREMIRWIES